jgi:hypothetical protein
MSDLGLNWDKILQDQAEEATASVLPEHEYDVEVVKAEATKASTGSPMIKLTCDIVSGPFKNKRLWTNVVLKSDSPGAMRMALKKLAGLGLSREWLAENNPSTDMIARAIVGKHAVAKVVQREWNNEKRNDIDTFKLSAEGATPAPPVVNNSPLSPDMSAPAPAVVPTPEPATTDEVATGNDPF